MPLDVEARKRAAGEAAVALVKGRGRRGVNRIPRHAVVRDARRYWPGVTGDPSKASRGLGERIDRLVERELTAIVRAAARRRA